MGVKIKNGLKKAFGFGFLRSALALAISLVIAVVIIFIVSDEPLAAIGKFLIAPITSARYFGNVIELMTPLLFTGLAMSFMLRVKMFNLAAEGSFFIGGLTAATFACLVAMPAGIHPAVAMIAAAAAGAIVGFVPGVLKIKFGANEVVSSLMLNYVVFKFGDYVLKTFLLDPDVTHVASYKYKSTALLPDLFGDFNVSLLVVAVLLVVAYFYIYRTRWGYATRLVGENQSFAKYAGVGVSGVLLLNQIIGGAIAGLGGAGFILSATQRFTFEWRSGYGWDGLVVAVIARYNPKLIPVGAFILAYLRIGADVMARTTDVQNEVVSIILGIIIILMASVGFLEKYRKNQTIKRAKAEMQQSKEVA